MGKSRRNRAKGGQRPDPIAKPVKPPADPALAMLREKKVLPVLKDLQSADPKSRSSASRAVANIIQDTRCRKLLLREQIVHIVLNETLTDASLESRAAGWEILRVLVAEEEADFCVHLYRIDCLTAIQHACANVADALTSLSPEFSKRTNAEQKFFWDIAESLTGIIAAIAEAQDEALDAAGQNEQIVRFLFLLVSSPLTTGPVLHGALSCMITLSEDNRDFVQRIYRNTECYQNLLKFKDSIFKDSTSHKAVFACAVLHNVFSVMGWDDTCPGPAEAPCDAALVPTLTQSIQTTSFEGDLPTGHGSKSSAVFLQLALEVLADIGTTLQETLAKERRHGGDHWEKIKDADSDNDMAMDADGDERNGDEDGEDKEDEDEEAAEEEDDEMDEDEMHADMEMVTGVDDASDEGPTGIDDLPTLKQLIHLAIPQLLKTCRMSGNDNDSQIIRHHAMTALNNIAWTVSCLDFTEDNNAPVLEAWKPVARTMWKEAVASVLASDTSDVGLATVVTSLAWALARTLRAEEILNGDEQKKFISLYHASRNMEADAEDPFQSLGVKCLGVLGQLARNTDSIELNREIGVFLVTVVTALPNTPAAEVVEALNELFDIYGDEGEADQEVFWKDNFLQHMQDCLPKLRTMIKSIDKSKMPELREQADETKINLERFIKYKQKNRPKK